MSGRGRILVDHTHCGRRVTGLERITLELFSAAALAPLDIEIARSTGLRDMIVKQTFTLPFELARDRRALLLCPGFPPSPLASLFGARCLPYIHDLFLITRPGDLNRRAKLYMAPSFRIALKRLRRFLVNSETTRDELARHCRGESDIILYRPDVRNVFGVSADGRAGRAMADGALRLIALGTVEPRKNLMAAAAILTALRARGFPNATLDIVGRAGWGDDATRLAQVEGVTLHGYQPIERARELLQTSDALISTSHDEGLGLPLLEAQYAGLATIAPNKPVFREVLGESGVLIDPSDTSAAAQRIAALAAEPGWRARHATLAAANLDRWSCLAAKDHLAVLRLLSRLSGEEANPC